MARPRLNPGDTTTSIRVRLPDRDRERFAAACEARGVSEAEAARLAINAWVNQPTNLEPEGLFGVVGEGGQETGSRGANAPAPGLDTPANPSHPEPVNLAEGFEPRFTRAVTADPSHPEPPTAFMADGPRKTAIEGRAGTVVDDPVNPSTEKAVGLMVALEDSVTAAKAARQAAAKAHKHTPMKAGMPIPRCDCGAIRKLDGMWDLETRPEATQPDASIDPEEEW